MEKNHFYLFTMVFQSQNLCFISLFTLDILLLPLPPQWFPNEYLYSHISLCTQSTNRINFYTVQQKKL